MKDTNTGFCQNHVMHYEQRCPECHDESVLAALRGESTIEVEKFDTEIVYDESGIEVGETSARIPVLRIVEENGTDGRWNEGDFAPEGDLS